MNFNLFKRQI
jgi:hypothetical protein